MCLLISVACATYMVTRAHLGRSKGLEESFSFGCGIGGASFVFFLFWLVRLCLKGMRAILPDKSHRWLQCSKGPATSS